MQYAEIETDEDLESTDESRIDDLHHPEIAVIGKDKDDKEDSQS